MAIHHIVLFQFKDDATPEVVQDTCTKMLGLKDSCIHPTTAKPYVKASMGGKNMSIEGLENGITHAFVVEFETLADRDFYVKEDKVHHGFVQQYILAPEAPIAKAQVIDFVPGAM
ncbi:hypothetical protein HIM_04065 [Hirsutella minnesotensis 3608]|uniref:Stress-response A/B barrel domain-containing protein n=1 Tax=Hirsutella minnesotensis 3608 TaxID=1043627 RepID=A0A0F8A6A3_9HYPO|nr:hypothetical protein HIM_04065 [Hirsutella minnesotensis 3608]